MSGTPFATTGLAEKFEYVGRLDHDSFDQLLLWASDRKSSDITFQSGEPVWGKVAGRWTKLTRKVLVHPEVEQIVRCIYGDNGPGEVNSGHDLDPSYEVKEQQGVSRRRFRVNITGGRMAGGKGFQLTIRTLPSQPIEIGQLGIEPEIVENLRPPQGMNLVTGPTGSGKSTLLSSAIRHLCEHPDASEKVVEYSRPIEYVYDGLNFPNSFVHQLEVGGDLRPRPEDREDGETSDWAYCVRNALRRAPDVLIIGEARDKATIQGCIELSLTGHLVMSTMHTIGVPETIRRAVMPFPGNERRSIAVDLLECLNLVVTQLLLPRKGGGKVGCREYMLFDRKVRSALMAMDVDDWPSRLREMLQEKTAVGSSMADSARKLLEADQITSETYEWIAARTAKESKLAREVIGSRLAQQAGALNGGGA